MLKLFEENGNILSMGKVVKIAKGTGSAEGRVVNVTFHQKWWDKESKKTIEEDVEVAFWNSKDGNPKHAYADFFNRCNAQEGSEMLFSCSEYQGKISGMIATYSGIRTYTKADGKEVNFIFGPVRKVKVHGEGEKKFYSISIPLLQRDGSTDWKNISFGNIGKLADRAEKLLKAGTKCVICTGEPKANDSGFVNYYGSEIYLF